jgi:hypothetical protein
MMTMRELKEAMKDTQILVIKMNGINVVPGEYSLGGIASDIHKVEKITATAKGVIEVELIGGTGVKTQGFKRA